MNTSKSAPIRICCPLCDSQIVARPDQIGARVTCDVCLEEVFVEQPATAEPTSEQSVTVVQEPVPTALEAANEQSSSGEEDTEWLRLDVDLTAAEAEQRRPSEAAVEDFEFTVTCPLCATRQSVTHLQVGKQIRCPDCHSHFPIPTPAKHARRARRGLRVEQDPEEFRLSDPVELPKYESAITGLTPPAPSAVAAAEPEAADAAISQSPALAALRQAEAEVAEEASASSPALPGAALTAGLLGFLLDVQTLARWVVLAIGFQLCAASILTALELMRVGGVAQIAALLLFALFFALGTVWFVSWAVFGIAIVRETAVGRKQIEHWPELDIGGWLSESLHMASALAMAILPGFVLVSLNWLSHGIELSIACLLGGVLLFPLFLMANLETDSAINIVSGPVFQSLIGAARHWLQFFGITILLFGIGVLAWQLRRFESLVPSLLCSFMVVGISIIYFRLLGRLTWVCQESSA